MIGGGSNFAPFGSVRHMTVTQAPAGLQKLLDKQAYNERQQKERRVDKGNIDPAFAAHLDLSSASAGGITLRGSLLHVEGVHNKNKGAKSARGAQDVKGRQREVAGVMPSMLRGLDSSRFVLQNSLGRIGENSFRAAPDALTLTAQSSSKDAIPASWQHQAPHSTTGTNELLGDDHLKMLLGDASSELMLRVQKAGTALQRLWDLLDTDGDGLISYYECRSIFSKWCQSLANDSEKHILDTERSSESRITYARFIDIFLPLALTVSPDLIIEHLTNRFTQVSAHLQKKKSFAVHEAKSSPNRRGSGLVVGPAHARRSVSKQGTIDMSAAATAAPPHTAGEEKSADVRRKKGSKEGVDLDIDASGTGRAAKRGSTLMRGVVPAALKLMRGSIGPSVGSADVAPASQAPVETVKRSSPKK